jgi:hypothetical protein
MHWLATMSVGISKLSKSELQVRTTGDVSTLALTGP